MIKNNMVKRALFDNVHWIIYIIHFINIYKEIQDINTRSNSRQGCFAGIYCLSSSSQHVRIVELSPLRVALTRIIIIARRLIISKSLCATFYSTPICRIFRWYPVSSNKSVFRINRHAVISSKSSCRDEFT